MRPHINAYISSQLVASLVAALLAEQKSADRAGALLRFVLSGSDGRPDPGARVPDGAAARVLAGPRRRG